MAETSKSECFSLEKDKASADVKCSSSTSSMLKTCVPTLSTANESTHLSHSDHVEVTSYNEKETLAASSSSNPVKMIWVVQKKNGQEDSTNTNNAQGPSSSVLKNLHLDHQYLSNVGQEMAPTIQEKACERPLFPNQTTKVYSIKLANPISPNTEKKPLPRILNHTRDELPGTEEFLKHRMQRAMDLLRKPTVEKSPKRRSDTEGLSCIPNAASIQSNFQRVLNMTSFQPISDGSDKIQGLDGNLFEVLNNEKNGNDKKTIKSLKNSDETRDVESVTSKETFVDKSKSEENDSETEKFFEAKLDYAIRLMLQRWAEYLQLPQEEISQVDVENAKYFNCTSDVIEMLEDKGRFVWQLIDGISVHNLYDNVI